MGRISLLIFITLITSNVFSQNIMVNSSELELNESIKYKPESLIIPSSLILIGFIGVQNDAIERFNARINGRLIGNIYEKTTIDDLTQYAPSISVYGLNALGVEGKHNLFDSTVILGTAFISMGISVNGLKSIINEQRPDGSTNNTFPSGHTATAFMSAEFLYQEFKDRSKWIGVSGYVIAGLTGYYRMAKNRHWLTDVVGGAGIGILSTKFAYWIHPFLKDKVFNNKGKMNGIVTPFYNGREYGLGLSLSF